jgi:ribonuclease-3
LLKSEGPDHAKEFTAEVHVGERAYAGGSGRSKKEAEQEVAEIAWRAIDAELGAASSGHA